MWQEEVDEKEFLNKKNQGNETCEGLKNTGKSGNKLSNYRFVLFDEIG